MFTGLTDTQLSGMGTALSQGGTGLLHIAIQLMPYAIAFTVIFFIFKLIKNWSKLKTRYWETPDETYERKTGYKYTKKYSDWKDYQDDPFK